MGASAVVAGKCIRAEKVNEVGAPVGSANNVATDREGVSRGALLGRVGPGSPYADPTTIAAEASPAAPTSYAALDGRQPGFLAISPWVLRGVDPADGNRDNRSLAVGDARLLESCEDGLAPGSGVMRGACAENVHVATAIIGELRLDRA